jgi:hypothetical protein
VPTVLYSTRLYNVYYTDAISFSVCMLLMSEIEAQPSSPN